jgi:hypothetical protein
MKVDIKKVKKELSEEAKEKRTLKSFRLSDSLFSKFQKRCDADGFSTARVLEKLMEAYVGD